MANDIPVSDETPKESGTFISSASGGGKVDTVYNDFFQETSDGKISVGSKAQKSGLETFTTIFGYVLPIAIVGTILGSVHVFLRTQESGGFVENYQFLCPYMNQGVNLDSSERQCETLSSIQAKYSEKRTALEDDILKRLNEYIPIKITKNLMATSPEKSFIFNTFNKKVHADEIINQFLNVLKASQYSSANNINCTGFNVSEDGVLTTDCTIYGKDVGSDDSNGKLGSSRIQTMKFIEQLSDTTRSHLILMNPPSSLGTQEAPSNEGGGIFTTMTQLSLQVKYVPFDEQP